MSSKLLEYLSHHPNVSCVWVNEHLDYVTGPCNGFEKVTRNEAEQLAMDLSVVEADSLVVSEIPPPPASDPDKEPLEPPVPDPEKAPEVPKETNKKTNKN